MTGTFSSPGEKIAKVTCKVKKVFKKEFVSTLKKKKKIHVLSILHMLYAKCMKNIYKSQYY